MKEKRENGRKVLFKEIKEKDLLKLMKEEYTDWKGHEAPGKKKLCVYMYACVYVCMQ